MARATRVLVTGASGRAGRTVAADLAEHGYRVVAFDVEEPADAEWECVCGDIRSGANVTAAMRGANAVCHIAGIPKDTGEAEKIFDVNLKGTFNVLEAARIQGAKRVVFASSIVVYGFSKGGTVPRYIPVDEEHPCAPATTYAATKLMSEVLCRSYTLRHGLGTMCLRLGNFTLRENVFSKDHDRSELGTELMGGKLVKEDLAQAFRLALESEIEHGVYIVTTKYRYGKDGEIDRGEGVERAARELGIARVAPGILDGGCAYSTAKAQEELGFAPIC